MLSLALSTLGGAVLDPASWALHGRPCLAYSPIKSRPQLHPFIALVTDLRVQHAAKCCTPGVEQLPSDDRLREVGITIANVFGSPDDFSPDALQRRGLTSRFWNWRDQLIENAAPSRNLLLRAVSRLFRRLRRKRYALDPETLTYGEFPLDFFVKLISAAKLEPGDVFCDLGSGCGRLVLAAALLWPDTLSISRGIEISPDLHSASEKLVSEQAAATLCPMELLLADIHTQPELLKDVDVCFCYSTRMQLSKDGYVTQLADTYQKGLRSGARMITTDRHLPPDGPWELIREVEGVNNENGGTSTGRVWRKL